MDRMKRVRKWLKKKKILRKQDNSETETILQSVTSSLPWRLEGLDERDRSYVEERMDPDFGLLDKLLVSNDVLTRRELNAVKSEATFEMRNAKLLEYISEKKRFVELADALLDTHQSHLVNYLDSHGVYDSSFGWDWPLTDREIQILDSNQGFVVDKLEMSMDLVANLVARQVINGRQRELLAAKQTTYEKCETLVDILRRGSISDYRSMIECLHETNQSHVALILERGGVVVSVHADLKEKVEEEEDEKGEVASQMEEEVVGAITHLLSNRSQVDSGRILELVQLRLIGVQVGRSVVLFFHCQTLSDLDDLHLTYTSGDLQHRVETVFHRLLDRSCGGMQVLLRWTIDDYAEMRNQLFLSCSDSHTALTSSISIAANHSRASETDQRQKRTTAVITGINDLPSELLETILEKFCLLGLTSSSTSSSFSTSSSSTSSSTSTSPTSSSCGCCSTSSDIFVRISSVESFWFELIRRPKFKRILMRHLSIVYSHLSRRSRIIRSNWTYLVETLKIGEELVKRLGLTDCLSDEQARSLSRLKDNRRRNEELLSLVKAFDAQRYSAFVRCLREDGQRLPSRIAEGGGAVLKAMVCSSSSSNSGGTDRGRGLLMLQRRRPSDQRIIITRINELQQKLKPTSDEAEKLLRQLKNEGCEIYGASEDRGIVISIFVHSPSALATLNDDPDRGALNIIQHLLIHLCASSYWNHVPASIGLGTVVVDVEQLRTDLVAISPIVSRLLKRLEQKSYVHGIATLDDNLYVLCHQPNAIRLYDTTLFAFQREIHLQAIVAQPWDMAASSTSNCLYVTDSHKKCVWKIHGSSGRIQGCSGREEDVVMWLSDISSVQFTLSVTSNDQVLLVAGDAQLPSLELYTADAQLARSIRLPGHIFSPVHAVVTSSGNFIIIYGWWNSKRWGICQLNSEGETIRRFRPNDDDSQQLNCPWHLAVDEDDQVFVADYENHRVILLDSDLSWVEIVVLRRHDNDGLTEPWRLTYSSSSSQMQKRLIVAHLHKVDVYSLTQM